MTPAAAPAIECGTLPCFAYCPVARLGQDCPDVAELWAEVSPAELARQLG